MVSATKSSSLRNFHLPLSDELHRQIRTEAERTGRPATVLVREAVEAWLAERRRAVLHAEIAEYAAKWAGSEIDLDPALDAASAEELRRTRKAR